MLLYWRRRYGETTEMKTELKKTKLTDIINLEQVQELSEAFKVLGDPTKLRICMLLSDQELPVSTIAETLSLSDSAASHSLRTLRNLRLVKYRRDGKNIFYSLDDNHVEDLIRLGCDHIMED
jgi:ArsR family transcriptional regulator, lead/cadmium/zinc/bismuth-responsive transcriptional repressor